LKAALTLVCWIALCVIATATRADDLDNIVFEGTIRDSAGAVIPAAEVRARHAATGIERAVTTDAEGRYRIVMREPGIYRLAASASGFNQEESEEIEVVTGRAVKIDFQLSPAGVSEQISVGAAEAPLVDTARTVVGDTISRTELESLPIINRDPLQLVFLLGGVAEAPLAKPRISRGGSGHQQSICGRVWPRIGRARKHSHARRRE
jgi:hypothetical protein